MYDGQSFYSPTNATPLETFKEDAESLDGDSHAVSVASLGPDSVRYSLKACKHENDPLSNSGDTTYPFFASLMDSSIQGSNYVEHISYSLCLSSLWAWAVCLKKCTLHVLFSRDILSGLMSIPDLILRFESSCRNVSESIRYVALYAVLISFILQTSCCWFSE